MEVALVTSQPAEFRGHGYGFVQRERQSGLGLREMFRQRDSKVTQWRKLTAGAVTAAICLFGLTAPAAAAGTAKHPARAQRVDRDRKPGDHPKLDRRLNDRADKGGLGLSRVIVTLAPGANLDAEYAKVGGKKGRTLDII